MQRFAALTISLGVIAVVAVGAAQTPDIAVCDGIATQIRGNREIAAGSKDNPLSLLSKGDHPYIELASHSDMSIINSSDALLKALKGFPEDGSEVLSLPDSDVHVIESLGGTANCEDFLFFQVPKGGQSQPLPGLPPKGVRDGDNVICDGYGDDGHLARVAGTDAFVEMMSSATDNNYEFRVVPFQQGEWRTACEVEADFRTEYSVSKVFVSTGGPVNEMELENVAAQIVELHAAAKDRKSFSFGLPVPESEKENVRTMSNLATGMQVSRQFGFAQQEPVPVPAFGREKELTAFQKSLQDVDNYPLVLSGRTYLMTVGHGAIGWRVSSDSGLILYTLEDGKLEPVGAAIVAQSQGALEFVRATEWKIP